MSQQFHAFVGETAFEELCRSWTLAQARAGTLPFVPEIVGSHWAQDVQLDVVALNWREQAILLGECKWGVDAVGRAVVHELIEEKTPKVLQALPDSGREWTVHHALFARTDFTKAAQAEAQTRKAILVDLTALDREAFEADKGP